MSICALGMGNVTLFCKYGKNHRVEECHFCELELRVNSLDHQYKNGHAWHSGQIDALDIRMKELEYGIEHINKKIFSDINPSIDFIKEISEKVLNSISEIKILSGKPHKCPVCEGSGEVIINNGQILACYPLKYPTKICSACKGKGIIWKEQTD